MIIRKFLLSWVLLLGLFSSGNAQQYLSSQQAVEDLAYLLKKVEEAHFNPFVFNSKEVWTRQASKLHSRWETLDSIAIQNLALDYMQLLALANCGHTNIQWFSSALIKDKQNAIFFPYELESIQEGSLVLLDQENNSKELLLINGQQVAPLYEKAISSLGGLPSYKQQLLKKIFFPVYLYLSNLQAPFDIGFKDGTSSIVAKEEAVSFMDLWQRLKGGRADYTFEILDGDVAYIAYNSCNNYDQFEVFLAETFKTIKTADIKKLIIDLRNNSGGDSSLNDLLIAYLYDQPYRQMSRRLWRLSESAEQLLIKQGYKTYFGDDYIEEARTSSDSLILEFDIGDGFMTPEKPKDFFQGKSCILIGPATYSSANMLADAVKEFQISTLIGSPTGQWTNDFGEMANFILPHSQLPFTVAMTMDVGASGQAEHLEAVQPDILVQEKVRSYAIEWLEKKN